MIFGLIVVLSLIAIGVVVKLKRMRRQIQVSRSSLVGLSGLVGDNWLFASLDFCFFLKYHSRGQLLAAIGSHKYAGRYRGSASINSSMESSSENCPICLDHYRPGEVSITSPHLSVPFPLFLSHILITALSMERRYSLHNTTLNRITLYTWLVDCPNTVTYNNFSNKAKGIATTYDERYLCLILA